MYVRSQRISLHSLNLFAFAQLIRLAFHQQVAEMLIYRIYKIRKSLLSIALPNVLLLCALQAQNTRAKELDNYFSALYRNGQFNGNVLVAEKGKIVYEKCFGYADLAAKKINSPITSFGIASITKTIVSTAILQLQEKGKLNINEPYIKYFPAFPYPGVTIKQLLSHTSRLPSSAFYRFLDSVQAPKDTFFTNADVIPALVTINKPLLESSGKEGDRSNYAYSNLNYYLLALLIERVSGMSYPGFLQKYIFLPAGMDDTGFSEFYFGSDRNQCKEYRYRYLYSDTPDWIDTLSINRKMYQTYNLKGHGDIISTLRDLMKFDQALYGGLLNENSLQQAYDPVTPAIPNSSGYGLGWSVANNNAHGKVVTHHGGGIGLEAMLVRNTTKKQVVILFDNFRNPAFNTGMNAMAILNGSKISAPRKSITKLYGKKIVSQGIPAARKLLAQLVKDSLHYEMTENEINLLGYQFLWNNMDSEALETLKVYLDFFPDSWNAYDSYGEILLKVGRKEEAIKMYQRSIELNPQNTDGKKILDQLLTEKK